MSGCRECSNYEPKKYSDCDNFATICGNFKPKVERELLCNKCLKYKTTCNDIRSGLFLHYCSKFSPHAKLEIKVLAEFVIAGCEYVAFVPLSIPPKEVFYALCNNVGEHLLEIDKRQYSLAIGPIDNHFFKNGRLEFSTIPSVKNQLIVFKKDFTAIKLLIDTYNAESLRA